MTRNLFFLINNLFSWDNFFRPTKFPPPTHVSRGVIFQIISLLLFDSILIIILLSVFFLGPQIVENILTVRSF